MKCHSEYNPLSTLNDEQMLLRSKHMFHVKEMIRKSKFKETSWMAKNDECYFVPFVTTHGNAESMDSSSHLSVFPCGPSGNVRINGLSIIPDGSDPLRSGPWRM